MNTNNITGASNGENKVLILYFLKKINGNVLQDTLFKLMNLTNGINYFVFNDILVDLVDLQLVSKLERQDDTVFLITPEGINSYELTKDLLPGLSKLQADIVFSNEYTNIENEFSVISEFTPQKENEFMVKCKIIENTETIFEIQTHAGSKEIAQAIVDNWNTKAYEIYPQLVNILANTKKE